MDVKWDIYGKAQTSSGGTLDLVVSVFGMTERCPSFTKLQQCTTTAGISHFAGIIQIDSITEHSILLLTRRNDRRRKIFYLENMKKEST
jgi:hypothetical protein